MKRLLIALLAVLAAPLAAAQEVRPTALLLDGLGVYVETPYIGVSALAGLLQRQGFRPVVDTHLMLRAAREEPVIVVGHSMGGSTALRFAAERVAAGHPPPVVITIDAAFGSPPCPVPRCINIHSPGFPRVEGAENVDAWQAGAFMVPHALLATNAAVQRMVLERTADVMGEILAAREQPLAMRFAPLPEPRPR